MILFKNGCYAVAGALLLVVAGLAGFGGVDAMYAQGWMIVLLIMFAISGLIVEIDQHVFPDKPPAAEEEPVTAASPAARATNRKFAGTLRAGAKDGWDVYDVDDELLAWRPDIRAGMELLEETAD